MQNWISISLIFLLMFYLAPSYVYSQAISEKNYSLPTGLRAAICDPATDSTVHKSTLLNCKRLIVIDSTSHVSSGFRTDSYEVIIVPKHDGLKVFSAKSARFNRLFRRALSLCSVGDQIIFRKIIAKGKHKDSIKLNALVLTVD